MIRATTGNPRALEEVWPTIRVGPGITTIGRLDPVTVRLNDSSISQQHACLTRVDGNVQLEDQNSKYGTFLNGNQLGKDFLRINDLVWFGKSPAYRFDGEYLRVDRAGPGMAVRLRDVAVRKGAQTQLSDVNMSIASGTFVGIFGPSGAGKSLLLGCLSGMLEPSSGEAIFDGEHRIREHLRQFHSNTGIVTQDEFLHGELSVEENLTTAAKIRIDDPAARAGRVEAVLKDLKLQADRQTIVKTLSGGQRKRLNIAIEMLTRPRLLLLDEPSSGLDAGMQAMLMGQLKLLARQGVTVVCATHAVETIESFDFVEILGRTPDSAGEKSPGPVTVGYSGIPSNVLRAFGVGNFPDLFAGLQRGDIHLRSGEQPPALGEAGTGPGQVPAPGETRKLRFARQLEQIGVVWKRAMLTLRRDRAATTWAIAQPCFLAVLCMATQVEVDVIYGLFFLVMAILWLGMTSSAREIVGERKLFIRDRMAGLEPGTYLAGKILFGVSVVVVQTAILSLSALVASFFLESNNRLGQILTAPVLAASVPLLIGCGIGGVLLGLTVSVCTNTERAAVTLLPLLLIPQLLFNRVAWEHGMIRWDDPSPYPPIINGTIGANEDTPSITVWADYLVSLPIIARPATATFGMLSSPPKEYKMKIAGEVVYLFAVLLLYGLILCVVFQIRQKNWSDLRG